MWILFLLGVAVGIGLTCAVIFPNYKVREEGRKIAAVAMAALDAVIAAAKEETQESAPVTSQEPA